MAQTPSARSSLTDKQRQALAASLRAAGIDPTDEQLEAIATSADLTEIIPSGTDAGTGGSESLTDAAMSDPATREDISAAMRANSRTLRRESERAQRGMDPNRVGGTLIDGTLPSLLEAPGGRTQNRFTVDERYDNMAEQIRSGQERVRNAGRAMARTRDVAGDPTLSGAEEGPVMPPGGVAPPVANRALALSQAPGVDGPVQISAPSAAGDGVEVATSEQGIPLDLSFVEGQAEGLADASSVLLELNRQRRLRDRLMTPREGRDQAISLAGADLDELIQSGVRGGPGQDRLPIEESNPDLFAQIRSRILAERNPAPTPARDAFRDQYASGIRQGERTLDSLDAEINKTIRDQARRSARPRPNPFSPGPRL